jgi:hypothetical protein
MMKPDATLDEGAIEARVGELSEGFAERVGALADLFARWRKPEVARAVVDSLIAGDREAFQELSEVDLPIPPLDRCAWIIEVVEKVVPVPRAEEVCRIRELLSPAEKRLYLAIVLEFRQQGQLPPIDASGAIQPGKFLEALKAADLVHCEPEWAGSGLEQVIGKPERLCL